MHRTSERDVLQGRDNHQESLKTRSRVQTKLSPLEYLCIRKCHNHKEIKMRLCFTLPAGINRFLKEFLSVGGRTVVSGHLGSEAPRSLLYAPRSWITGDALQERCQIFGLGSTFIGLCRFEAPRTDGSAVNTPWLCGSISKIGAHSAFVSRAA